MGDRVLVAEIPPACEEVAGVEQVVATRLKISVLCGNRPVVQVSFPAYAILSLADLVPAEVKPRIAAHRLDLEELAARHAAQGCLAGELFTLPGPDHTVRAWME
jgi:hypothetical protein